MTYTEPLLLIFSLTALAGILLSRRRLSAVALLCLILISWPPVDYLLSRPLEARYPVEPFRGAPGAQAIVVLASAVDPPHYERPYPQEGDETYSRTEMGAWLYRHWRAVPVLVCGGAEGPLVPSAAAAMRDHLLRAGVPAADIWMEARSQNTYENALYGAPILRSRGVRSIVLVVEARSMLRAAACFRKQGLDVAPAPSGFREFTGIRELLPSWKAVRRNEAVLHEALGLAWYRLRGRI